jgi:hypothetical protein
MIASFVASIVLLAAPAAFAPQELPAAVANELERALARGFDASAHEELYRLAIVEWADVTPLVEHLVDIELAAEDSEDPAALLRGGSAMWLRAHVQWRFGDLVAARRALEELVELAPNATTWWELGCLHDALDATADARAAYEAALAAAPSADLEARLRLRLAMLSLGEVASDGGEQADAAAALVAFGQQAARDADEKNRAAIVLALDGRFAEALELFQVGEASDAAEAFRRELRLAEWALAAGDAPRAQQHADTCVKTAGPARDRRYAWGLLVEAHRLDKTLDALVERLAADTERTNEATEVWIELLRETGRFEDAHAWFRAAEETGAEVPDEVRRRLLDLCREWGREDLLETEYRRLVAALPVSIVWREGLSRFLLEKGRADDARAVWNDYLANDEFAVYLLSAADALNGLGLDDLALDACERCVERGRDPYGALLLACSIHRSRGRLPDALAQLERLHALAPADAPERLALAEAFEELGALERAVVVLEGVKAARGEAGAAEDLDMRLAWMLSEVDRDEDALRLWDALWRRIEAPGRRRYVEERLMSVASRLGVLADIAIDLETKLARGEADDRDAGLLVQLYSRVADPVSATEVLELHLAKKGTSELAALEEKARIFLQCNDYYRYESTLRRQMALDPDGAPDYLRQLAMSALERGQANEARVILDELLALERSVDSAEFEAGVLALAGLREDALAAYRRGVAGNPDRIENYLLLANVMRELGQRERAIGMFQYLAERAEEDDLFTIAIDGLLNMEAGPRALRWARRCALERIAGRHDKVYLYQLVADLSEQLDDAEFVKRALEGALPISAERRVSLLRELMERARGGPDTLRYGRRLVNSGQLVPPDVYLELGSAFLAADDIAGATRTFAVADSLQESSAFTIDVARVLERSMYLGRARDAYQRALIGRDVDVGLIVKLGEVHEQIGDDAAAVTYYERAADLLIARQPLTATKSVDIGDSANPYDYWSTINVDEYDQFLARCLEGLVTTLGSDSLDARIERELATLRAELVESLAEQPAAGKELAQFPRVARRADLVRRLALDGGAPLAFEAFDLELVATFTDDEGLFAKLVDERLRRGQHGAARRLWERANVTPERRERIAHAFDGGSSVAGGRPSLRQLPRLVAEGRTTDVRALLLAVLDDPTLLAGVDTGALFAASRRCNDPELDFRVLRTWLDRSIAQSDEYGTRRVMEIAAHTLADDAQAQLLDHAATSIKSDDVRASALLGILLELEESSGRELVDAEEMAELVERAFETRGYWSVYPFFAVLPPEDLAGIMRRTIGKLPESSHASFLLELFGNFDAPLHADARDLLVGAFKASVGKAEEPQYMSYTLQSAAQNEHDPATARELIEIFVERWGGGLQFEAALVQCLVNEGRGDEALALLIDMQSRGAPSEDDWEAQMALQAAEAVVVRTHRDQLVEHLLTQGEQRGELVQARERCEQLVRNSGDPDAVLAFRRTCAARWPNDDAVLEALADELRRHPELLWEQHAVLEQRAALGKGDEKPFDELARFWKRLDQPLEVAQWKARSKTAKAERRARERAEKEAREAAEEGAAPNAEGAASTSDATGGAPIGAPISVTGGSTGVAISSGGSSSIAPVSVPAAPVVRAISLTGASSVSLSVGGAVIAIEDEASAVASDGETPSEKAPPANFAVFRERIDGGDDVVARAVFRRMWRSFPNDDESGFFFWSGGAGFGGWNGVPEQWPGDLPAAAAAVLAPPEPEPEAAEEAVDATAVAAEELDETAVADGDDAEIVDEVVVEGDAAAAVDVAVDGAVEVVDAGESESTEDVDAGEGDEAEGAEGDDAEVEEGESAEEGEAKPDGTKRRGGLDDFRVPTEEPQEEPTATYDVLACIDVGRDEMWRQLRTRTPDELDHCGALFEALANHARRTLGDEAALDALLARFADDSAGRIELELLLAHLDAGVGAERADVRAVLDRLLATVAPGDSKKLATVARLLAMAGRVDQCAALLPYCASIAARGSSFDPYAGMVMVFGASASSPASIDGLLEAARSGLAGEARHAVMAEVLAAFEPLDLSSDFTDNWFYDPFGGPQDEWYAIAVIEAWRAEFDARGAFERCRSIAEGLAAWDGETVPPRRAALAAAQLAARAGEAPLAARLLAVALARHEMDVETGGRIVFWGEPMDRISRGALSSRDIDALFPADVSAFADFDAWAIEASAVLRQLVEADALDAEQGLQAIGVAASRLVGRGGAASLDGVLFGIESHVAREPEALLWVLDGVVAAGRTELALAIESAFAEARLLRTDRVVDAVRRARDARGPEVALELAERFATYTLRTELLDVIDELCVATANTERAAHWSETRERIGSR